jgi:hypothetical protein
MILKMSATEQKCEFCRRKRKNAIDTARTWIDRGRWFADPVLLGIMCLPCREELGLILIKSTGGSAYDT